MIDGIKLTEEFIRNNKAELVDIAKSLFCMTKEGHYYPIVMEIKTDFGNFTIIKHERK